MHVNELSFLKRFEGNKHWVIKQDWYTSQRFHHQWPLDVPVQHVTLHQRCCVEVLIIHTGLTNLISENGPLHFQQTRFSIKSLFKCQVEDKKGESKLSAANAKSNMIKKEYQKKKTKNYYIRYISYTVATHNKATRSTFYIQCTCRWNENISPQCLRFVGRSLSQEHHQTLSDYYLKGKSAARAFNVFKHNYWSLITDILFPITIIDLRLKRAAVILMKWWVCAPVACLWASLRMTSTSHFILLLALLHLLSLHAQIETLPHTQESGFSNKKLLDQRQAEHKGAAGQVKKAWSPSSSTIPAGIERICH